MKQLTAIILITIGLILQGCNGCSNPKQKTNEIILADASVVWWMAPGIIAQSENFYEKNDLKVKSFDVQTGLASKNAVLSGSADIGLVATTPLALGAFQNEGLIILCSYVESNELIALVTKDNKDTSLYSRPTPPIAVVKGTISEIYLYNYLKKYYPQNADELIKDQLNIKPPDAPNSMKTNSSGSASIWEPFGAIMTDGNPDFKINRSPDVYTHRIYIVTTPKVLKEKREAVENFIKSFQMACDYIKENPSLAQEKISSLFPQQKSSMLTLWDKVDFSIKYDYERMKELLLLDVEVMADLQQTPKDSKGDFRRLTLENFNHLFDKSIVK